MEKILVEVGLVAVIFLLSAELYDPTSGTWSATGKYVLRRVFTHCYTITDGKVLVQVVSMVSLTIFKPNYMILPQGHGLKPTVCPIVRAHNATVLLNGKVLMTGGHYEHWLSIVSRAI